MCDERSMPFPGALVLGHLQSGGVGADKSGMTSLRTLGPPSPARLPALPIERESLLRTILAGGGPSIAAQPIVDLHRGVVVGFEALARFPGAAPPDHWFAAAEALGLGPALDAHVLRRALARREDLPPNTFLSVNLDPTHIKAPEVQRVFADLGDLRGIVVELTEHNEVADLADLLTSIDVLRNRGAKIALDDAGSGYAGLQWLMMLRPDVVKLDKALVTDIHLDETKVAMVEMLGSLTGRMDAWLLAEGVEEGAQLEVLARLGVPLGQGYFLARPALGAWATISPAAQQLVRDRNTRRPASGSLAPIMESVRTEDGRDLAGQETTSRPMTSLSVVVDITGRPEGLRRGRSAVGPVMLVKPTEILGDIVRRAMTRPDATRWDPVVVTDVNGRCLGIVRMERLVEALIPTTPTLEEQ